MTKDQHAAAPNEGPAHDAERLTTVLAEDVRRILIESPEATPNFMAEIHANSRLAIIVSISATDFEAALDRHGDGFRTKLIGAIRTFVSEHATSQGATPCTKPPRTDRPSAIKHLLSTMKTRFWPRSRT